MDKGTETGSGKMSVSEKIGTVLFFISFLPLIYAIYRAFTGVMFGLQGFAWFFGFTAIVFTFICSGLAFLIVSVSCLIYQIVFSKKVIRNHANLKKASLFFVAFLVLACVSSSILAETSRDLKIRLVEPKLKPHLSALYGEKAASEVKYQLESKYSIEYAAHSPVLPGDKSFKIEIGPGDKIYDNLATSFMEANNTFFTDLTEYIIAKENLPADLTYRISIVSIDFKDYRDGDDYSVLFERTKYAFTGLTANYTKVTDDVIMDITNKVWNDIYPKIPVYDNSLTIYVNENGRSFICADIHSNTQKSKATVRFGWMGMNASSELDGKKIELTR